MPQKDDGCGGEQHLKGSLFHGAHKHICDSVKYLYSAPDTSYLQLIVSARKAESENEETWEKVRAKATVTSNLGEGMAELSWQIAKLMARLDRTAVLECPR